MEVGDIVNVTRTDGRSYVCFVVEDYKDRNMFYGRVLESHDKISCSDWPRYGLKGNGVCQLKDECKDVRLISKSKVQIVEDLSNTKIFRGVSPSGSPLTFCLSEDFGGWSEDKDEGTSIFEAYTSSRVNKEEVLGGAS